MKFRFIISMCMLPFAAAAAENFSDAVLVLHRGTIVYERYLGVTRRDTPPPWGGGGEGGGAAAGGAAGHS